MKNKITALILLLCLLFLFSCAGQNPADSFHVPGEDYFEGERAKKTGKTLNAGNITGTKYSENGDEMPDWFLAFMNGGIDEVERMDSYGDKYVFIGMNEGENLTALNMWADNYSAVRDFPMLAAARIEARIIFSSYYYPEEEYGLFFGKMMQYAYSTEYSGTVKEDTFWIKTNNESIAAYNFFVLITIGKTSMQNIINDMMLIASEEVTLTEKQKSSIKRMQKTFFEGF